MDSKIVIGQRIKAHRIELNLSQEGFADKCGIDRTYVSSIEQGKRNLSIEVLIKITTALGIKASDLLKNIEDEL